MNKEKKVFKPKRGFFGRIKRLFAGFKQLGVTSREVITEKKIIKQIEKEKKELLEAYVRAWEKGLPIKDIIKLKHLFPGKSFMLSLSKLQIKRLKIAMEKKKLERKNKILLEAA